MAFSPASPPSKQRVNDDHHGAINQLDEQADAMKMRLEALERWRDYLRRETNIPQGSGYDHTVFGAEATEERIDARKGLAGGVTSSVTSPIDPPSASAPPTLPERPNWLCAVVNSRFAYTALSGSQRLELLAYVDAIEARCKELERVVEAARRLRSVRTPNEEDTATWDLFDAVAALGATEDAK